MNKITPEIEQQVCGMIADGKSLTAACQNLDVSKSSFLRHVLNSSELADQYARSLSINTEIMFEEIDECLDEEPERGPLGVIDNSWVNLQRLKIDAEKWKICKRLPKKYGEKIDVTSGGESISKININLIAPDPKMKELYAPTGE